MAFAALGLIVLLIIFPTKTSREPPHRPVAMGRLHVRGRRLYAGSAPWRAWGMNWGLSDHSPVLDYLDRPSSRGLRILESELQTARRIGANSMRIPIELATIMRSSTQVRPVAIAAFQRVLALATRERVYLDIAGNLVWRPERVPGWYDRLSETRRWDVQAAFWRAIARAASASPAVLCYELTSEPVISDAPEYYTGAVGRWTFVQRIASLRGRSARMVARAWTAKLAAAVRGQDDRPVTIGLLPLAQGGFAPANVADLLDMLEIHEYPKTGNAAGALDTIRAFGALGRPVLLGETFPIAADLPTQRAFLLGASRYLVGAFEFFDGRDPNRMQATSISDAIYQLGLRQFIALRGAILQPR